ncbi:MAG TPA: hypothetical protein VFG87_07495 [Amycolatopsis sp.]|nr:hypothetical protein [Amycolatopsis sp.]
MNRIELDEALRLAGVPESEYLIVGIPRRPGPLQDTYYVLHEVDDGCLVTLTERGAEEPVARFPTEDDACRFLYDHLARRAPEPSPGSDEIIAELTEHRDEIQRRAWEQYDQARRDHE